MTVNSIIFRFLILATILVGVNTASAQTDAMPSVAVKLAEVSEKTVGKTLSVYGILDPDPDQILSLSLPKPGLINRVWVRLGQRIRRGERLLEVVTSPEAHMQFLQAENAVDFAVRELQRQKTMMAGQLTTRSKVDAAARKLRDAKSGRQALRQRGYDRSREILFAPKDGIVTRLDVFQGKRVPANSTAMLIATEKRLVARLGVEPENLYRIQSGTPVTVTSVFVPDITVHSRIREIHAMINPATHLVEILVPIPDKDVDHLILGSRVTGRIHLPRHLALMVPRTAVLSAESSGSYVFTAQGGKAKYTAVKTGIEEGDFIEVTGDLKKGDKVIVSGNYELHGGMAIREVP